MAKYHFNKDTGRTGKCEAKIQCRLGLAEAEHFGTREEAQAAFEKTMEKKDSGAISKGRTKSLDTVKFNVEDKYPYDQDQNLNGKTISEYREFIVNTIDEYSGKENEIKDAILEKISVPSLKGIHHKYSEYSVSLVNKDEIEISRRMFDNAFGFHDDGYEYIYDSDIVDNIDTNDFLSDEMKDSPYYVSSSASVDGYYADEHIVNARYRIPKDSIKDAAGVIDAKNYSQISKIAKNPAFPDWSVLPEDTTLDKEQKEFENPRFQRRPNYPNGKIRQFKATLTPDAERARLTKLKNSTERNKQKLEAAVEKAKNITKAANVDKNRSPYGLNNANIDPNTLSKDHREKLIANLESKIRERERYVEHYEERISSLSEISDEQKEMANKNIEKIKDEYNGKIRHYTVEKLSRNYPSSNETIRLREAEKWVNKNPEILDIEWF